MAMNYENSASLSEDSPLEKEFAESPIEVNEDPYDNLIDPKSDSDKEFNDFIESENINNHRGVRRFGSNVPINNPPLINQSTKGGQRNSKGSFKNPFGMTDEVPHFEVRKLERINKDDIAPQYEHNLYQNECINKNGKFSKEVLAVT